MTQANAPITIEEIVRFKTTENHYVEVERRGAYINTTMQWLTVEQLEALAEAIALALQHMRGES